MLECLDVVNVSNSLGSGGKKGNKLVAEVAHYETVVEELSELAVCLRFLEVQVLDFEGHVQDGFFKLLLHLISEVSQLHDVKVLVSAQSFNSGAISLHVLLGFHLLGIKCGSVLFLSGLEELQLFQLFLLFLDGVCRLNEVAEWVDLRVVFH